MLCNALYSNVNVVPASLDGLVAAAAALERECHARAEYRSEVFAQPRGGAQLTLARCAACLAICARTRATRTTLRRAA